MGKIFLLVMLFLASVMGSREITSSSQGVQCAAEGNKVGRESVNSGRTHGGALDGKENKGVSDIWGMGTDHIIGGETAQNSLLFGPSSPNCTQTFFISKQDDFTSISVPSFPQNEVCVIKIKNISPDSEFIELSQISLNEVNVHVYNTHDYGYTFQFFSQLQPLNETKKFSTELGQTLYLLVAQRNLTGGTFSAKAKSIPYNFGKDTRIIVGIILGGLALGLGLLSIIVYFWIKHKRRTQVNLDDALTPQERLIIRAQQAEQGEWQNRVSSDSSASKESFDSDLNLEDIDTKTENLVFESYPENDLPDKEIGDVEANREEGPKEKEKNLSEPLVAAIN